MKVAITGIIGVSKGYGGFETLAENLLGKNSPITTVYCSSAYFSEKKKIYKDTKLVYLPIKSKGYTKILHTGFSMLHAAMTGHKKILLLGVSGGLTIPILKLFFPKIEIITNIDGLEWKRGKWSYIVSKFLKLLEYLCCKFSDVIVADNEVLASYVKDEYGFNPVQIAYGGDQALAGHNNSGNSSDVYNVFALCRIVPENNVHMILKAFSKSNKLITFIGNWDDSKYGIKLKKQYINYKNFNLKDPIFDQDILYKLRSQSHAYVHGHSVGGTNPALVEMMHFGKIIYAFDCGYNRATLENNGKYFKNEQDLQIILKNSPSFYDDEDGRKIKKLAKKRYTWNIVRQQYFNLLIQK